MQAFFGTLLILVLLVIIIEVYFWPYNITLRKKKEDKLAIFIINLILAWTIVGWIVCLMWAISLSDDRTEEEKEAARAMQDESFKLLKKHWKIIVGIILGVSIIAGIFSGITNKSNPDYFADENYDIKTIRIDGQKIEYDALTNNEKEVREAAKWCKANNLNGAEDLYQCIGIKLHWF